MFLPNFSTFRASPELYLEDLFVAPAHRGKGHGKALLRAVAHGWPSNAAAARLEWSVLNWNEPSIRFYQTLGAAPLEGWTVYRLAGDALAAVAR